jgi:hypothetical protein
MTKSDRRRLKRVEAKLDELLDLARGDEVDEVIQEGRRLADEEAARRQGARTPAQVEAARRTARGCCDHFVDTMGCDCLARARAAERGRA